ncbi:putative membrane protein [Escherichia coli 2-210-07_S3_C3]|nr:putative membrane protein [Escherichia coli 2-156-04_S3_C1]KDX19949.1 putative membrane protein [Escherichia coli 2-210-07_S3_C3]
MHENRKLAPLTGLELHLYLLLLLILLSLTIFLPTYLPSLLFSYQ